MITNRTLRTITQEENAPPEQRWRSGHKALRGLALPGSASPAERCEEVCDCLADEDAETRHAAAIAVGEMATLVRGTTLAMGKVLGTLHSEDGGCRIAAALAIGYMGQHGAEHVDAVKDLLDDTFSENAANSLTMGGCRAPLPPERRKTSCAAAVALGRLSRWVPLADAEDLAASVARLLAAEDWEARVSACEALALMGLRARSQANKVARLFQDSRHAVRAKAAFACGKLGAGELAARLAELLEDKAPSVREQAVRALPDLREDGSEYIDKICECLADSAPAVRAAAAAALAAMGEKGKLYMSAVSLVAVDDEASSVRIVAEEALLMMQASSLHYALTTGEAE